MHPLCVGEIAELERRDFPEYRALLRALRMLAGCDGHLGYPHASAIRGREGRGLRELRPRRGRSAWRLIYRPGRPPAVLALAPEAQRDPRGFRRAIALAQTRAREDLDRAQ